jgi:hypothetical protein
VAGVAPAPATLPTRAAVGVGTAVAIGLILGGAAWLSDQLPFPASLLLPLNAIGPWLAVAFALGASARTVPTGALRALLGLIVAVGVYYALTSLAGGWRQVGASHAATVWGAVALVTGPAFGLAGATWRHRRGTLRAIAVAALAAVLIAEGVAFGGPRILAPADPTVDPGAWLFVFEAAIGAVMPWLLLERRERLTAYAATAALAVAGAIAIGPVTAVVREIADRF